MNLVDGRLIIIFDQVGADSEYDEEHYDDRNDRPVAAQLTTFRTPSPMVLNGNVLRCHSNDK